MFDSDIIEIGCSNAGIETVKKRHFLNRCKDFSLTLNFRRKICFMMMNACFTGADEGAKVL
jgi:hypothetical protein